MVFSDGSCVSFLFMAKSFCPIMHFFVYFLVLDCRIWRHLENEQLSRRRIINITYIRSQNSRFIRRKPVPARWKYIVSFCSFNALNLDVCKDIVTWPKNVTRNRSFKILDLAKLKVSTTILTSNFEILVFFLNNKC